MKHRFIHKQSGLAIMILVFMIAMVMTALAFKQYDANTMKQAQFVKTQQSLAIAKNALLAYSLQKFPDPPIPPDESGCNTNCPRPGDMPCPDTDNDGDSDCNTSNLLGRLPWKTLGIDDIRDGANERLWYGVSRKFMNFNRQRPLNSESEGSISLRNAKGILIHDASSSTGLVAIVIASGQPITRQDGLVQSRSVANQSNPKHYLDIAFGEDSSDFTDGGTDGFVSGNIEENGQLIVNDMVATITATEMSQVMQNRVLVELKKALDKDASYPNAADSSDTTCLVNTQIVDTDCMSVATSGLIPVSDGSNSVWPDGSVLKGAYNHNWFQQNGWRTLVQYNPTACAANAVDCLSF